MKTMEILNLVQGSDEWILARLQYLCASEAPAMMGVSKFMTRNQLLDLKKGWQNNPTGTFKQKMFDQAHEHEDSARELMEFEICEDLPAVVGLRAVEGLKLLSSFDGLGELCFVWEHKEWNNTLAENLRNGIVEPLYFWQLEQQMLVAGVEEATIMTSDGTMDNRVMFVYKSVPKRRKELIAGWKQFLKDLAKHELKAKQEVVVGQSAEAFPVISYKIEGSMIVSNIADALPLIKQRADAEMSRTLETDQDFANKENLNKETVKARAMLKEVVSNAKGEFVSFSEFSETAAQIDSILQKMQSQGEKQVKQAKDAKKKSIEEGAHGKAFAYLEESNSKIKPLTLQSFWMFDGSSFAAAMKGKRTIDSLQSAVDDVVAKIKIEMDQVMSRVVPNQIYLEEHATDYHFLFADVAQIINQETEPFQAIVCKRIADHKEAEEQKLEDERERIRKEEKDKLEAELKEKAEKVEEPAPVVTPEPVEEQTTFKTPKHQQPVEGIIADHQQVVEDQTGVEPTFLDDISSWADRYSVSELAVNALSDILKKHSL